MKIAHVERIGDHYAKVTFERDGERSVKSVRLSDCERAVYHPHMYPKMYALSLMKAAREADRDIAFKKHGEDFMEHCEYKSSIAEEDAKALLSTMWAYQ